jgi:hypothetical protein
LGKGGKGEKPFPPLSFSRLALGADSRSNFAMKHAGADALNRLEPFLKDIRKREDLKEKSRGTFYRGGRAFLHFHEHGEEQLFADIRLEGDDFDRLPATTIAQRKNLLRLIDKALADRKSKARR